MKKVFFGICFVSVLFYLNRGGGEESIENETNDRRTDTSLICNDRTEGLAPFLAEYATGIESEPDKWMYSNKASDYKDCSGMFIRLCEALSEVTCDKYLFPGRTFHSSRALAAWYYRQGELQVITKPMESSDLIQVGQVMFYGQPGTKTPKRLTIDMLSGGSQQGLVGHVGVVVAVDRTEEGELEAYTIYHGRSSGKPAARSIIRKAQNPDFGNWGQPWLAVGPILINNN